MDLTYALDLNESPVGFHRYCEDVSINFQCNRWVQWIGQHAVDELMAVSHHPTTYAEWIDTFLSLGAAARDHDKPVDGAYFDRGAEFFMEPTDLRKAPTRRRIVATLEKAFDALPTYIPFGKEGSLPAYDLTPEGEPNGTWVVFGGFDSYVEEWFPMLAAAVARGRRVIVFDGPGQGGALEDQHLPMIVEWERPVHAVLDHFALDDVTLIGASLGGELAIRAAAFEPRAHRIVAFDAMDDFLEAMLSQTAPKAAQPAKVMLTKTPRGAANALIRRLAKRKPVMQWGLWQGMHVTSTRTPADLLRFASRLHTTDISARVRSDVLLLQGAEDHYVPLAQIQRQARTLTNARSVTTRTFTARENASSHCQIGNIGLATTTILNWEDSLTERRE